MASRHVAIQRAPGTLGSRPRPGQALRGLIEQQEYDGPHPVGNGEFMAEPSERWGPRLGWPAAERMVAMAALFPRSETALILKSHLVISEYAHGSLFFGSILRSGRR